ncbi:hypothetical protein Cni_G23484 [Canna indica]|uniref:Nitrate regulatory gene2 protein-like n=1 Tax=Canna indica TaxID=4628 RepID=A0AAQ3KTJ5_9LILI|nr:hypothetical protein Cni_G23484 [Canna indica]
MGAANSKIEEEKALLLCRERKRFIRKAIDERCSLAAAHFSYVQSLRNTGIALQRFVEPEAPTVSSLYTSTAATPEPLALTDKAISHFSNSSPSFSQHVETTESFSSAPSPPSSGLLHINHMKATKTSYTTIKEKPPTSVMASLHTSNDTPKLSEMDESSSLEAPSTSSGAQQWDYFGLFHPIENQLLIHSGRGLNNGFDNVDEIRRLREEEGIPELEEEGERASTYEKNDQESEDDFDQPSNVPLVRMYKNQNLLSEHQLKSESEAILSMKDFVSETKQHDGDNMKLTNGIYETDGTPETTPTKAASHVVAFPINGKAKESEPETNHRAKDLLSCMKDIEDLFLKASESGREVPRMLEANKVQFRPLFPEEKAHGSKASAFLTAFLSCCREEIPHPPVSAENDIKYIIWHRSMSSLSSSSRNFIGTTMNDDVDDLNSNLFHSTYMNSGSHASTLDRLYAWERKLYDEVKASGIIRREYDMRCRLLRHRESIGENQIKIDKTRAVVKDLHSRIRVAIQRIDSISKKIEEIRDKELQPQLEELIGGLTRMWRMMFVYHNQQYNIVLSASNNGSTKVSIQTESQRQTTVLLEYELNSLSSNFTEWMSAHKSYLNAINGWLLKSIDLSLKPNRSSRKRPQPFCPRKAIAPPIFVTCQDWLSLLEDLPTKDVVSAIKDLVNVTSHFLPRQEKGHGTSKSSFSLPRKTEQNEREHILTADSSVDWSLNYDHLQSALTIFLDRLKSFAEASVTNYENLQKSISEAKDAYDKSEFKK